MPVQEPRHDEAGNDKNEMRRPTGKNVSRHAIATGEVRTDRGA
jgi:hypothetical protein